MGDDLPPVPEVIDALLHESEIENMKNLRGWAVGTVVLVRDGEEVHEIGDAWIELFNGEGTADVFGGVRFMAVDEEEGEVLDFTDSDQLYIESYAYATREAFGGRDVGWFVKEYTHPEDPEYGVPAP